ncbi:MAG: hypothetical protein ACSNEK_03790 [Parachlamydiaceae bacterium]
MLRKSESLAIAIFLFYTAPIFMWSLYGMNIADRNASWTFFCMGLLLLFFGTLLFFFCLRARERLLLANHYPVSSFIDDAPETSLEARQTALQEEHHWQEKYRELQDEFSLLTLESSQAIEGLKNTLDQKQQQITHLENQIHDLRYEIKTLLNLTEIDYSQNHSSPAYQNTPLLPLSDEKMQNFNVANQDEAKHLLKQCLGIAQKMTGSNQLKSSSKLKLLPLEHTTLDLRVLFDAFREDSSALITIFSTKDRKLIFANHQTKPLFGYHPEKFVQDFLSLIRNPEEWNETLDQLSAKAEATLNLSIKSKSGETLRTTCCLSNIPTGIFRDLGIGIFFLN